MGRMDVLAEDVKSIGFVCTAGSFYKQQGLKLHWTIVITTHILGCQTEFEPQPSEDVILRSVYWIRVTIFLAVSSLSVLFDLQ
jgi:hypothetical protein